MRLFSFNYTYNYDPTRPVRAWRWSFHLGLQEYGFYKEAKLDSGTWVMVDWYCLCVTKSLLWGRSRSWYDGPHDTFSVGPFHFNWRDWSKGSDDVTY